MGVILLMASILVLEDDWDRAFDWYGLAMVFGFGYYDTTR